MLKEIEKQICTIFHSQPCKPKSGQKQPKGIQSEILERSVWFNPKPNSFGLFGRNKPKLTIKLMLYNIVKKCMGTYPRYSLRIFSNYIYVS